ncbi:uncharacterized protein LOC133193640 isoform X2 [Saccostrea echinata]|uniref:uncharacterized protein LOC133193640 isoform X2 n=1 Tax=Saccostrea echinata TaxID=191078 RepID=UPI002A8253F9|nr:uncharacterized protein LOC133193640 isoform X2 [Saccostrea echinata]
MMRCPPLCKLLVVVIFYCVTLHRFVSGNTTEEPTDPETPTMFTREHISRMHQRYFMRQEIRAKVLEFLGWTSIPQINPRDRAIINSTLANISSIRITERQCFSASCDLPNRIDETLWNDSTSGSLRLMFDVLPSDSWTNAEIVNATLMLHLKERPLCNCEDDHGTERISIKVLQYLKPLRRRNRSRGGRTNRRSTVRQRILWTSIVNWTPNTWVAIPVQQAANDWIVANKRNHGFEVMVIDQYNLPINATNVFSSIECRRPADVDCIDTIFRTPLYGGTSPFLQVYKTESPFVNQRAKREAGRERYEETLQGRPESTQKIASVQ